MKKIKSLLYPVFVSLTRIATYRLHMIAVSVILVLTPAWLSAATLEVMNPRGDIPPPEFHAPAERISDLEGKRIGLYWIGKAGGDNFWDGVAELLQEQYPGTEIVRYMGPFDLGDARAAEMVREVDTVFYGVGD